MSDTAGVVESRPRYRWTVADYHRMGEVGLLHEDSGVELINGEVVEMAPIGSQHGGKVDRINRMLNRLIQDMAIVRVQNPVSLGPHDEPEPDLALLRYRDDYYEARHPGADDVLLLIEVSDSTLRYDRETKLPRYALHGIAEVWIVNLPEQCLEVYRDPGNGRYRSLATYRQGTVSPLLLSEVVLDLTEVFPDSR